MLFFIILGRDREPDHRSGKSFLDMKLHITRHAQAIASTPQLPDEHRYLTCRGRRRFRQVTAALKKLGIDPDLILTSPKARALQTAEILAEALSFPGEVQISPLLAENFTVGSLRQLLLNLPRRDEILIVGHEPDLSTLITELLTLSGPCRLARGSVVTVKLTEKSGHLTAELLSIVTGSGKVLSGRRKALERLEQPPLPERKDDDFDAGTAADSRDRKGPCPKADRCRKRQLCKGCSSR
jgi:phosphohistidine phosphatase